MKTIQHPIRWAACFLAAFSIAAHAEMAVSTNGMVVSGHSLATKAGVEVLKRGGNAIDAAVAVGLTLGIVDAHNSGIGGGCFLLIRRTNGAYVAIDGRETAPGSAKPDMFIRNGKADPDLSRAGALAAATPGALAAYDLALQKLGKTKIGEHLLEAAKIAESGFPADPPLAAATKRCVDDLGRFAETRAIFLSKGQPLRIGQTLKQPDLARTYRQIASNGLGWFYGGPFAQATEKWMKQNGGILDANDFKNYQPLMREPLFSNYRGYTIATFPPPSSGGIHLIQILKMVETRDLYAMRRSGSDVIHFIAEAMKIAFADRAYWLGDPDYVKVPRDLMGKAYCRKLADKISLDKVAVIEGHDTPANPETDVFRSAFGKHTTHFCTADSAGNWVACTATINTSFGSKVVIPGTGVLLNNEMDDFSAQPGVANHFGLVGGEANAIAPGKRPLSSMTPAIISKEGRVQLAVGAAGGPTIISQVAQAVINYVDFQMQGGPELEPVERSLYDCLRTPRFHHQWKPDELMIETKWDSLILQDLEWKGTRYTLVPEDIVDPLSLAKKLKDASNPVSAFLLESFNDDAARVVRESTAAGEVRETLLAELNRIIQWNGMPQIRTNDVRDFWAIVAKIKQENDPLMAFFLGRFTAEMRKQALASENRAALPVNFRETFINELNRIIETEAFYRPEWFAGVSLPADVPERAAQVVRGTDEWNRLNRLLMEKAFSGLIHKNPASLLYTRQRFAKVVLSPEAEMLAERSAPMDKLPRMNRWALEAAYDGEIVRCRKQGHVLKTTDRFGACQAICFRPEIGFVGCPDPRGWGLAEGY